MKAPPSPRDLRAAVDAAWGPRPGAEPTRDDRPRMTLRSWKLIRKGSLIGMAGISLAGGLEIDDVAVLKTHGKAWATLPARPVISSDGRVCKIPGTGKTQYVSFLRWRDRDLSTAFSDRVVALVRQAHPDAFDDDGGAP
jgi:hypothetical protein